MTVASTFSENLPREPGLYRLWMDLEEDRRIRIGALGEIEFSPGRYGYTGSARSGIRARVSRHLAASGPRRWHIDYLLPHVRIVHVEAVPHAEITECAFHAQVLAVSGVALPVQGFGSSDCRCPSHLVRVPLWTPVPLIALVRLRSGERMEVRLLRRSDANMLGAYFAGLSARTRARYGPHPFDEATANQLCESLDPKELMPFVGVLGEGDNARIIAYLLVKRGPHEGDARRYEALGIGLDPETTGSLAPSVADEYQNRGVASAMMPHVLTMIRSVGIRRLILWGGVIADNYLAQGFYRKWGFVKVGEFTTSVHNHDMLAEIAAA